ncbi:MAG TPA: ABC transporter ATP-binding protein [Xanthobacteraceae bacterium]
MSDPLLNVANLVKRYGDHVAVNAVSFTVGQGEFFTLLGPSGCGKTTTLRLLAGLETPDAGEITLGSRCLAAPSRGVLVAADKRDMGMVFQSYAIWPHLTVFENVAFPLRARRQPKAIIEKRVREALEIVGLGGLEQRGATELSGGQQQRVALARAIVYTPALLLLDEPLSNLDVKLREQMRTELHTLHRRLNLAVVYVTHDQGEALALSDRIAVVNQGRLEQVGTPVELYERPSTRFVGDFLGRTVVLDGIFRNETARSWIDVQGQGRIMPPSGREFSDGELLRVVSRPEDITLLPIGEVESNEVKGRIENVAYMGDHLEYTIVTAGRTLVLPATKKERYTIGTDVRLAFDPARITILPQ